MSTMYSRVDDDDPEFLDDGDATVGIEFDDETTCRHCSQVITANEDGAGGFTAEDDTVQCGVDTPHEPTLGPASWANGAHVTVSGDEDSIEVSISVGDPRGAFTMTVRRVPDSGRLILYVPYEGMGFAHMPLRKLADGTYEIGN